MEDMAVDLKRLGKDLESGSSPRYTSAMGTRTSEVAVSGGSEKARARSVKLALAAGSIAVLAAAIWVWATLGPGRLGAGQQDTSGIAIASTINHPELRQLTFNGASNFPLWSPDGGTIAFLDMDTRKIQVVEVEGGTPRTLDYDLPKSLIPWNWDRDGTGVLAHYLDEENISKVVRVDLFGEPPRILADGGAWSAHLHPDGDLLAYALRPPGGGEQGIWTRSLKSGAETQIIKVEEEGTAAYKPQWSPSGDELAFIRWDGIGHELWVCTPASGGERKIDTGPVFIGGHYDWTPDGEAVVVAGRLGDLWSIWYVSTKGRGLRRLSQGWINVYQTTISPDGRSVAFGRNRDRSNIGVISVESAELLKPVSLSVATRHGRLAADGKTVVFQALINGLWQLWATDLGGESGPHAIGRPGGHSAFSPSLSRDGEVFHIRSAMRPPSIFGKVAWSQTLWRTSLDGGRHEAVPEAGSIVSRLGPVAEKDGLLLYGSFSENSGAERLCLLNADGQLQEVMRETRDEKLGYFDWWHGDHQIMASIWTRGKGLRLMLFDLNNGERKELTLWGSNESGSRATPLIGIGPVSMAPHGREFAVVGRQSREMKAAIYIYDLDGHQVRKLYDLEEGKEPNSIVWSPDGKYIVIDLRSDQVDIYILEGLDTTS